MRIALAHPLAALVVGSLTIAWAGILVRLADVDAATSATFRCLYAAPVLLTLMVLVRRRDAALARTGIAAPLEGRARRLAVLAGIGSAGRLLAWHASIAAIGAGMATVVHDAQVVLVPLAAWFLLGLRPSTQQLLALPIVLVGCVLISGVLDASDAYGSRPSLGALLGLLAAAAYVIFQLALKGAVDRSGAPVTVLCVSTTVSFVVTGAVGLAVGGLQAPSWPEHGWLLLLAIGVQVVGWLLIATSMLRVGIVTVSFALVLQPLGSMLLAAVLLQERPAAPQWAGVVVVVVGILVALVRTSSSDRHRVVAT